MNTKRYLKSVGLGIAGLLILTAAVRGEMRLGKTPVEQEKIQPAVKEQTSAVIQFQGLLPGGISGRRALLMQIYTDSQWTELLAEHLYPEVEITNGVFTLPLSEDLGLDVGQNYFVRVEVVEEGLVSELQLSIHAKEQSMAADEDATITAKYDIQGNYPGSNPETDFVVRVTNIGAGYGLISRSNGGTAVLAETQGTGIGVHAKNLTGTALKAEGNAEITGDLTVSGQTSLTSVNLPAGSVGSSEIVNGSIQNEDIAAGLNADTLDGKDSTEFLSSAEDAVLNGNLTVNGTGNSYFAGKLGIGTGNINLPSQLTVFQKEEGVTGIRVQGENTGANLHIRPSPGKDGEISFTEDTVFDRWVTGIKGADHRLYFSSGTSFLSTAVPRLVINGNDGNVGIGTDTPVGKLNVIQTEPGTLGLRVQGQNMGAHVHIRPSPGKNGEISFTEDTVLDRWVMGIKDGDSNLYFSSGTSFLDTATLRMVINGYNGNVGIGTPFPENQLEITKNLLVGSPVTYKPSDYTGIIQAKQLRLGDVDNVIPGAGARIIIQETPSGSRQLAIGSGTLQTWSGDLVLNPGGNNVGIGTNAPSVPLHVVTIGGTNAEFRLESSLVAYFNWQVDRADGNLKISSNTVADILTLEDVSGNVGIGTLPSSLKLDVAGYVRGQSGLCIGGDCRTSWPATGIGGGGSGNSLAKFNGPNTITNSIIQDDGSNVGIGLAPRPAKLSVYVPGNDTAISVVAGGPVGTYHLDIKPLIGNGVIDYQFAAIQEGVSAINVLTLRQNGNVDVGGNLRAANIAAHYQDLAEWAPSTQTLTPGTVVVIDENNDNHVVASTQVYDSKVAGVVSYLPGLILGEGGEGRYMIAHTGRVKVKADASYGAIKKGDLLVTSPIEGTAMKSQPIEISGHKIHQPGTILGKALESLSEGTGEILVLLSLQ